jgi:NADH-quinone oxidoreductase subunit M
VILAGVLLKMGTYGFLRFSMPLFPAAAQLWFPLIGVLSVIGIIYGALVAMVQPDMKKLVAYSSVSHLGFVMLGLSVLNMQGVQGGVLQMINHGLSTGALFILVGMVYERRHTRMISDFGGLARALPLYAAFFMIVTLSSIGLPGLNGFVGEFLILLGAFQKSVPMAVLAAFGVILAAVYMLWMFKRVLFGPLDKPENRALKDLSAREVATLVPLVVLIVWIGVYPQTFLRKMDRSVEAFLARTAPGPAPQTALPAAVLQVLLPDTPEPASPVAAVPTPADTTSPGSHTDARETNVIDNHEAARLQEEPQGTVDTDPGILDPHHRMLPPQQQRPQPDHGDR